MRSAKYAGEKSVFFMMSHRRHALELIIYDVSQTPYKWRDVNPPYFRGRLPIVVNIFVHFDTQIW